MNTSTCGIRRAATRAMLSWVEGNSDTDQLKTTIQAYLDRRVGKQTSEANDTDHQRIILIRWTVACAVMAPVLQRIPQGKVQPLFEAVRSIVYTEQNN